MPFHHRVNEGLDPVHATATIVHGTEGPKQVRMSSTQDAGLLQVPHRQAGSVRLRACAGQGERLPVLPHGSRRAEPSHAEGEQRQLALPAVPHDVEFQQRAGRAVVPQPGELLPGMHAVPRSDSRLEFQFHVFQVEAAMTCTSLGKTGVSGRRRKEAMNHRRTILSVSLDGIGGSVAVGARGARAGRHGR